MRKPNNYELSIVVIAVLAALCLWGITHGIGKMLEKNNLQNTFGDWSRQDEVPALRKIYKQRLYESQTQYFRRIRDTESPSKPKLRGE